MATIIRNKKCRVHAVYAGMGLFQGPHLKFTSDPGGDEIDVDFSALGIPKGLVPDSINFLCTKIEDDVAHSIVVTLDAVEPHKKAKIKCVPAPQSSNGTKYVEGRLVVDFAHTTWNPDLVKATT